MAQTPTSPSVAVNNAAKDDAVGLNGDYNFTIKDLLANDPGGAAKVDVTKQFFFGDAAPGSGLPSIDAQVKYLAAHGITAHVQNGAFVSFDIGVGATDINYFVQIGNKGTWSEAHVDVTAPDPVPDPVCVVADIAHNGSFENGGAIPAGQDYALTSLSNWYNSGAADNHIEVWNQAGLDARTNGLQATGGHVIETDGWGQGNVDPANGSAVQDVIGTHVEAVEGKTYTLSFDYASRADTPSENGNTDTFDVYWNGEKVGSFDPNASDHWTTASITVTGGAGTDSLEFRETGSNDAYGALIDNVKVVGCNAEDTPDPVDVYHNGALVAEWTFENHTQAQGDNTGTPTGFWNLSQWAADHPGIYGADADNFGFTTDIQVHGDDGHRALDTAGSPGNIFLQAIPEGRGGVLGQGATMPDLVAGQQYHAEVSIQKQNYTGMPGADPAHLGTDPDAWVSFQFNNTVLNVHASDIHVDNEFVTFDAVFEGIAGEDSFTLMSHGTNANAQGLLIDNIAIHDWLI